VKWFFIKYYGYEDLDKHIYAKYGRIEKAFKLFEKCMMHKFINCKDHKICIKWIYLKVLRII